MMSPAGGSSPMRGEERSLLSLSHCLGSGGSSSGEGGERSDSTRATPHASVAPRETGDSHCAWRQIIIGRVSNQVGRVQTFEFSEREHANSSSRKSHCAQV